MRVGPAETPIQGIEDRLSIRLFGSFELLVHGAPGPPMRSRKEYELLALLTLQKGGAMTREGLAQQLWPYPDYAKDLARA